MQMNVMSLYSVDDYDKVDEFKRVVALSKNQDMLNFANNAYAVNEEDFPINVKKTEEESSQGKRKIVEVVELSRRGSWRFREGRH